MTVALRLNAKKKTKLLKMYNERNLAKRKKISYQYVVACDFQVLNSRI